MKNIDTPSIGKLPHQIQILLLDYMKLLDQKHHVITFGVLLPTLCLVLCSASLALNDLTLIYATWSLFISFACLMVYAGKPWMLISLLFSLKNYRIIFKEEYQLDIRKLRSSEIWAGLTVAIDHGKIYPAWESKNTLFLLMSLFVSVMTFGVVLFGGIFLKNPSFWIIG